MKRRLEAEGSPVEVSSDKIPSIRAESPPVQTSANSSSDLGEILINLPKELREKILFSLSPKERRRLRLVNKAMLDAVDISMSDVQDINIISPPFGKLKPNVRIKTINPYNGAKEEHEHRGVASSLPFLLKWAGAQLKTLDLTFSMWVYQEEDSDVRPFYCVLEALNKESTCPKLKNVSLYMKESLWDDNKIILSDLLKYITKRQLQAKAADQPIPFLHSLSLISDPYPICPVPCTLDSDKRRQILQDILDQCHGLKILYVDSLLKQKDLPIVALRYPTTLTCLKSERLGKTPGELHTIIENCPNLQIVCLVVGLPHDDANIRVLPALSDLRALGLRGHPTEEKIAWITGQCLAAFKDHPFGASIARLWPQLISVTLDCYQEKDDVYIKYRLHLSGSYCCITSLHLTWCSLWRDGRYAPPVEQLFKALNSEDVCSNLMDLYINSSELVFGVANSLTIRDDRELQAQEQRQDDCYEDLPIIFIPSPHVYGILNDLLAYVTKRQSEVQLGKAFLRLLSIGIGECDCDACYGSYDHNASREELVPIHTAVQQILDQCHGLEILHMESLDDWDLNPNKKKGKELMELVRLRFPTTLKKLNGVSLN